MISGCDASSTFHYWWEFGRYFGVFQIEWVYITDIHFEDLYYIFYDPNCFNDLPDGIEIPLEHGRAIMERFRWTNFVSDIFEAFEFMDQREIKQRKLYDFNQTIAKNIYETKEEVPSEKQMVAEKESGNYFGGTVHTQKTKNSKLRDNDKSKSYYYEDELKS